MLRYRSAENLTRVRSRNEPVEHDRASHHAGTCIVGTTHLAGDLRAVSGPVGRPRRNRLGQRERSRLSLCASRWPWEDAQGTTRPSSSAAHAIRRDRTLLHRPHPRTPSFVLDAVKITRFDPARDLVVVKGRVWGPGGKTPVSLALDTGSAHTVIAAGIIDDLGYNPRHGEAITTVRSAVGKEQGYLLRISRFWALGSS